MPGIPLKKYHKDQLRPEKENKRKHFVNEASEVHKRRFYEKGHCAQKQGKTTQEKATSCLKMFLLSKSRKKKRAETNQLFQKSDFVTASFKCVRIV